MTIWALVEVEPYEAAIYWGYYDSIEKAELAKIRAEYETEWEPGFIFSFIIEEINVL